MSHTTIYQVIKNIIPRQVWGVFTLRLAVMGFTPVVRMAYRRRAV